MKQQTVLTFIVWSSHMAALQEAAACLPGDVCVRILCSRDVEEQPEACLDAIDAARAVFVFRGADAAWNLLDDRLKLAGANVPVVCVASDPGAWALSSVVPQTAERAYRYLSYGGAENAARLMQFMLMLAYGQPVESVADPLLMPWEGLWHPEAPEPFFENVNTYSAWYNDFAQRKGLRGHSVGLLFGRHYWVNSMTQAETALVQALEARGLRVLPAFSNSLHDAALGNKGGVRWAREVFLDASQQCRVQALIKLLPYFSREKCMEDDPAAFVGDDSPARDNVRLFRTMDVPVFQPVFTSAKTVEAWQADPQGLGSEVAWAVALPEFEGVVEPFFLGGTAPEKSLDSVAYRAPVAERVQRLAARVDRWLALQAKPVAQRRVAFILHNDPCSSAEATVGGAAGLDTPASLCALLRDMREAGYDVQVPENSNALMRMILDRKAVSEFRWTSVQEISAKGGVLARIPLAQYERWAAAWPAEAHERIDAAWGRPGQGKDGLPPAMTLDGHLLVTGISLGNAVVCVQPKRGCAGSRCDGQVCRILHDPDIPPPHQYIATYRWLQDGFGADAIVHVGTHGTLEFLPGKACGLSAACLPDVALHEVPHLYIYNADNPAEAVMAKRRSYAALVNHMRPPQVSGGLHDKLEALDNHLGQWGEARRRDPARAHQLEHLIREAMASAGLADVENDLLQKNPDAPFSTLAAKLHEVLNLLRNTRVDDGLHVLGQLPQGKSRADFIYALLRHDTGAAADLRRLICAAKKLDLDALLENTPQAEEQANANNGQILQRIDALGASVAEALLLMATDGGNPDDEHLAALLPGLPANRLPDLYALLARVCNLAERLDASQERAAFLHALTGSYITPGPSGLLARGRDDILPTGRNSYTLDPRRLPTEAAWRVGCNLARGILDKHLTEEGRYPENVAMFWMCNDLMWSDGEGLGQLLALLGVRPVWQGGVVTGHEVIPLEELGRPRVDITVRVSGLLRDSFPEAVRYLDAAVLAVAELDEQESDNYVRMHSCQRLKLWQQEEGQSAWRRATLRIFSSQPGVYQGGVDLAVHASAWRTEADLSDVFVRWNSYAYGEGVWGQEEVSALTASLSNVDITYNKVVSDEHDMLNCCAIYGIHGGMTAAAKHLSGHDVRVYYGDTRDPQHVQVRDMADEIRRVARGKLLNPLWIEGMKRHGYKGAGDMSKRAVRLYGWDATTGLVDDGIFDDIVRTFVLDKENRAFFEENNPWALEEMSRRLLEAQARGVWQADKDVLKALRQQYLDMEGWLEERTEAHGGSFQGGSIDIFVTPNSGLAGNEGKQ
ncbi:MAG: cobaltochelatase subunit CobN [Desulfovibrio sp.]|uniref:cobaltochelatase subunit CobN n=1 Tax=Desulfovibrio sp. TaxID=885 RepID=UPI00135D37BE|nr:cobaltochelatase subunit CobN [Desulfovibrio sp.]MTJ93798.1 cobaltochelatase subunit CobN [Desulfovibrio sp.]